MSEKALHDQIIENPKDFKATGWTVILVKEMGDALEKAYPGWRWMIQPDERGKIVNIWSLALHDQWGYTVRFVNTSIERAKKMAIFAGGEILERFGMPRRRFNPMFLRGMEVGVDGKFMPDAEDKMTRQQLEQVKIRETVKEIQAFQEELRGEP